MGGREGRLPCFHRVLPIVDLLVDPLVVLYPHLVVLFRFFFGSAGIVGRTVGTHSLDEEEKDG